MNGKLSVAEVAELHGTGRVAAYRWLLRNAKEYIKYKGRFVYIEATDYEKLGRKPIDPRVARRLTDLESRTREQTRRLDKHAEALSRLNAL